MHEPQIEIRLLFESDIPSAMRLKEAAGWNQTEADWRRLLTLEPHGCFAALKDGSLVGTTTTTTYEAELAWIGMVLVDPPHRRQGIANRLMETALEYLKDKVKTVKLDATPLGKPVYERFSFEVESMIERWSGSAKTIMPPTINKTLNDDERHELFELDQKAFSADRSKLIELLIADALEQPVLRRNETGALCGYALARRGTKADYIGPVVTTRRGEIESLLDHALSQSSGRTVYIDFNTECGVSTSVLADRGFVKERDLIRMSAGRASNKTSPFVIAIAGPEIG